MTEHQKEFHIKVDREPVVVLASENPITGAELKKRGNVPAGYDLWQRVPGPGKDKLIEDVEKVTVDEGMHFYSTKAELTPGERPNAAR